MKTVIKDIAIISLILLAATTSGGVLILGGLLVGYIYSLVNNVFYQLAVLFLVAPVIIGIFFILAVKWGTLVINTIDLVLKWTKRNK